MRRRSAGNAWSPTRAASRRSPSPGPRRRSSVTLGRPTAEVGDQRIVGVERQRCAGQRRDQSRPAVGDRLQLAVAVELVAEQVAEQDRPRMRAAGRPVKPELVDLEQAELAADRAARPGRREQASTRRRRPCWRRPGCGRASARPVEGSPRHRRCRGLAVGRRDHRVAPSQAAGEPFDRIGLQPRQQLSRQAGAAAATGAACEFADRPRGEDLRVQTLVSVIAVRSRASRPAACQPSPAARRSGLRRRTS